MKMDNPFILSMLTMLMTHKEASLWTLFMFIMLNIVTQYHVALLRNVKAILPSMQKKTKYTIKANLTFRYNMLWNASYPVNFLALCRKLKLNIMKNSQNVDYQIREYPSYSRKDDVIFVDLKGKYKISESILISTEISFTQSDKGEYDYITLQLLLETNHVNFKIIEDFITICKNEYNEELVNNVKSQHVFIFDNLDKEAKTIDYQEFPFDTTKSFDNMFFNGKQEILDRIDHFTNNKAEYIRLGMPYNLGILLHGEAGTGKTSFCKSLAKYTERHIVILPTKKINCIETLKSIFLTEEINGIKIPNNKRLYVFEDIDCGSWRNIVISRALQKEQVVPEKDVVIEVINKLAEAKKSDEDVKKSSKSNVMNPNEKNTITLGDFLELLDGIVEIPGRMIIMTSNHPEILDPALIRPGRVDIVIEFKKLSKENVADMYKLWFGSALDEKVYKDMKDYAFTQADIGNLFASRKITDIHAILRQTT
jgi:hypothetical protein